MTPFERSKIVCVCVLPLGYWRLGLISLRDILLGSLGRTSRDGERSESR